MNRSLNVIRILSGSSFAEINFAVSKLIWNLMYRFVIYVVTHAKRKFSGKLSSDGITSTERTGRLLPFISMIPLLIMSSEGGTCMSWLNEISTSPVYAMNRREGCGGSITKALKFYLFKASSFFLNAVRQSKTAVEICLISCSSSSLRSLFSGSASYPSF